MEAAATPGALCAGSSLQKEEVAVEEKVKEAFVSLVDPFLVEALENPRHRLTVLRMELDIQRFMLNSDRQHYEFQHVPTSYLRCAAHRVAQHYGLQTMVADNMLDGFSSRILALKTPESRFPAFTLSDIPTKLTENEKTEVAKVVICQRPSKVSQSDATEAKTKRGLARTVEERKEEYDKARARIFNGFSSQEEDSPSSMIAVDVRKLRLNKVELEGCKYSSDEHEIATTKDGASRVAILKDREKDLNDPDYDRSYDRYTRGLVPSQNFSIGSFSIFQPPFLDYEAAYPLFDQFTRNQSSMNCGASDASMNAFGHLRNYQTPRDSVYMQWPTPTMLYAHSYEQFRHGIFQAPSFHHQLSFESFENH